MGACEQDLEGVPQNGSDGFVGGVVLLSPSRTFLTPDAVACLILFIRLEENKA